MDTNFDLINVSGLKKLIKNEIDRNVSESLDALAQKLQRLEKNSLNCSVEIYGLADPRFSTDRKVKNHYIKKICALLDLNFKAVLESEAKNNYILVHLKDAAAARDWQTRSCQVRLKNRDLGVEYDGPVKIFVAASHERKQLLKKTRDALLPRFKYVSLCKTGVMARRSDSSKIYIIKNERDIQRLIELSSCADGGSSGSAISFENDDDLSKNYSHII
ncbi:FP25K [Lymantria xylina nucleopolyhedrovirus]|uniref:FP25K protein n=2 Tax=Lymantria xylina nucleopolyhedrovirus TaxID=166921 RepID=B8X9U1_9ABAC|nr:FP25K [Lymantria xylina nucleopolyhedrovirus]ACL31656.1 FP25K protein [Lymantria xylina nucleopolyhedrovirus]ADD73769.1 FP25K [Lymantria xylina nucleopolyhedrovirus]